MLPQEFMQAYWDTNFPEAWKVCANVDFSVERTPHEVSPLICHSGEAGGEEG